MRSWPSTAPLPVRPDSGAASSRLNPFALPTDTTSRFVLLVVAVVGATLSIYNLLGYSLPSTRERVARDVECRVAAQATPLAPGTSSLERERIAAQAVEECRRPVLHWLALVITTGLSSVVLLALGIYLLMPTWKIRRRQLVRLEEDDAPELVQHVRELSEQSGLARPPKLLWNPLAPGGGALAFGRFNDRYVAVGAGLVVQFYAEPRAALAVVRHELAHVVNRDVSKTYLALSLWYAFVVAGLLPLLVMEVVEGAFLTLPTVGRLAALVVLVYAARNAVLRAREFYADAWAGSSEDDRRALSRVLQGSRENQSRWRKRIWSLHPSAGARARALADPDSLFRPYSADIAAAGVLAGFSYPLVEDFLFLVVPLSHTLAIAAGAALVSASLIGVVLGTVVLRAGLAARARDRPLPRALALALAAALGFGLGSRLSLEGGGGVSLGSTALLAILVLASTQWLIATADAWFDVVPAARSGRAFSAAGLVAATLVVWSTGWASVFGIARHSGSKDSPATLFGDFVAPHPFTPVVTAALVLFPLTAARMARRVRAHIAPAWVLRGDQSEPIRWPSRPPLAVTASLKAGALGGLLFCVAMAVLEVVDVAPRSLIEPIEDVAFQYGRGLDYASIALAVIAHAVIAAVVALRAKRLPLLQSLLMLPASVLLMTVGVALPRVIDSAELPEDLLRSAKLILTGGVIATLLVGGVVQVYRRRSAQVSTHAPRGSA